MSQILIVDDEKNIRLTVGYALEAYDVTTAVNGEDALQQLQENPADLVLLDLRMPGMDGLEVLTHIARDYPQTRVVILTAHGTVENAIDAMKLGAIDFVQKPFTPQELRTVVEEVLSRQKLTPPEVPTLQDYETYLQIVKKLLNERQWAEAQAHCQQAIGLDPQRPEAFNLLGALHDIQREHPAAMKMYRVALDLDPTYKPAQFNLARDDKARTLPQLG